MENRGRLQLRRSKSASDKAPPEITSTTPTAEKTNGPEEPLYFYFQVINKESLLQERSIKIQRFSFQMKLPMQSKLIISQPSKIKRRKNKNNHRGTVKRSRLQQLHA
eukprot:403352400